MVNVAAHFFLERTNFKGNGMARERRSNVVNSSLFLKVSLIWWTFFSYYLMMFLGLFTIT
jgi:hypothetical protein